MASVFSSLHESLQQVLAQRLDWRELREVQEEACRVVRSGGDALILAPTAGGKSEAALIPVVDDLLSHGRAGVACLYIAPLKALINDQEERFRTFCTPVSLAVVKWHGDVARGERSWKEGEPPHFLMITPESLEVLLQENTLAPDLRQVRYVIVDELHAFMESERGVHLKMLLYRLDLLAKRRIQRIGLSATVGNPREVLRWLSDGRHGADLVRVPAPAREKEFTFIVEPEEEDRTGALVRIVKGRKALVFVSSRSSAEQLVSACAGRIPNLHVHHSSISPAARKQAEEAFRSQEGACIICTSTLELGIDIGDLDIVVQVGPPYSVSSFLQRMGRSGRRGEAAFVAWILKSPAELLCSIAIIECAVRGRVEDLRPLKKPYNVLLQQILLRLHTHPRTTRRDLAAFLAPAPAFEDLTPEILNQVMDHLIGLGFISIDGEMLMTGPEAERAFGRSNWKDLYSVITGGGEYRAVTPDGEVIGMLDARFVNGRDSTGISLGGRNWTIAGFNEGHDIVVVIPGGTGPSRMFWTGSGEDGLSLLICRTVQELCSRGMSALPLGQREQELLIRALAKFPAGIGPEGLYILEPGNIKQDPVTIVSMNGSMFNRVLALLLRHGLGRKVRVQYNDFLLTVDGAGRDAYRSVILAVQTIRSMDKAALAGILPLPPAEGWKFARALPGTFFRDMIISDFYHGEDILQELRRTEIFCIPRQEETTS